MPKIEARVVLLDIEGTTSSIEFVYDTMFPYIREHLPAYLKKHWNSEPLQKCLPLIARDLDTPYDRWLDGEVGQQRETVVAAVIQMMDRDLKATGLKQLQGLIWKDGFESGQLVSHLFDDVAPAIQAWHQDDLQIRIYSSGSIGAQKLFFEHTLAGNLLEFISGHYDTTTGPKRESASYQAIARDVGLAPREFLFVSDIVEELDAAQQSGMQTALSIRPQNHPVEGEHGHISISSFDQLSVAAAE